MVAETTTKQRINQLLQQDAQTDNQFNKFDKEALAVIRDNLQAFYVKYAGDNGLTVAQTKQRVNQWDKQQWRQVIKTIDMQAVANEPDAKVRAKLYSYQAGLSKGDMLNAIIGLSILAMFARSKQTIETRLNQDRKQSVEFHTKKYDVTPKQLNQEVDQMIKQANQNNQQNNVTSAWQNNLKKVLSSQATVDSWSDKIWLDADKMVNDVQTIVTKKLRGGITDLDLAEIMQDHINPKAINPNKSAADRIDKMQYYMHRIMVSESQKSEAMMSLATFKKRGIGLVNWVDENDSHVCDTCQGFADDSPYKVELCPIPVVDSHPSCRCHLEAATATQV